MKNDFSIFATPWFTSKRLFLEMFVILFVRKSDEDEGYVVLKAYGLTWAEFLDEGG